MNAETTAPRPSIFSANLLYLAGMIMVLVAGTTLQNLHFGWGLLATEILIGLLALLWVRANRLPARTTLRLHPAPASAIVLAFLMGIGVWFVDTLLGSVTALLFGYNVPTPPGIYPQTLGAALLLLLGFVVGAPLGEELMFRGYIQVAYERLRPAVAIILVALLFSVFHLSLQGLVPRVPVALALGYVAWRSGSLWPGVALHAANNLLGTLVLMVAGMRPGLLEDLPAGGAPACGAGFVLLLVAGWAFHRAAGPRPAPALPTLPERRGCLVRGLPIAVALLIFVFIAATEVIVGRFPELFATGPLALGEAPWPASQTLEYELLHPGGEPVGTATCVLGRDGDRATAGCDLAHEAFEVQLLTGYWADAARERSFTASYDAGDMSLLALSDETLVDGNSEKIEATPDGDGLLLHVAATDSGESSVNIPTSALIDRLWPWQLSATHFTAGGTYSVTLAYPQRWDDSLQRHVVTVTDEAVVVGGVEPVSVPVGDFLAWKVTVGDEAAWYEAEPPYTLVQYDCGLLTWRLASVR